MGTWADYVFGDPEGDKRREENALTGKLAGMKNASRVYAAMRPETSQAHMNALGNRMSAYQGANNAMATMYGQKNAPGFSQLMQNPMSQSMLQQGSDLRMAPKMRSNQEVENTFGRHAPLSAYGQASPDQGEQIYGAPPRAPTPMEQYEQSQAAHPKGRYFTHRKVNGKYVPVDKDGNPI